MAATAFETKYRKETIAEFNLRETLLRKTVVTDHTISGGSVVFLVTGSGGATATTRGIDGKLIPRQNDLVQNTAVLKEWHDLVEVTGFNVFASQGDHNSTMQQETVGVINRKVDESIITELGAATTQFAGVAAGAFNLAKVKHAIAILGNNKALEGSVAGLITPGAYADLLEQSQFTSADFVSRKPFEGKQMTFSWAGVDWIVHPNLPNATTDSSVCYVYHKNSMGHAMKADDLDIAIGYDDKQQASWARASGFFASKALQPSGIVGIRHTGSNYAATA